jgi:hypothetical protein
MRIDLINLISKIKLRCSNRYGPAFLGMGIPLCRPRFHVLSLDGIGEKRTFDGAIGVDRIRDCPRRPSGSQPECPRSAVGDLLARWARNRFFGTRRSMPSF